MSERIVQGSSSPGAAAQCFRTSRDGPCSSEVTHTAKNSSSSRSAALHSLTPGPFPETIREAASNAPPATPCAGSQQTIAHLPCGCPWLPAPPGGAFVTQPLPGDSNCLDSVHVGEKKRGRRKALWGAAPLPLPVSNLPAPHPCSLGSSTGAPSIHFPVYPSPTASQPWPHRSWQQLGRFIKHRCLGPTPTAFQLELLKCLRERQAKTGLFQSCCLLTALKPQLRDPVSRPGPCLTVLEATCLPSTILITAVTFCLFVG